MIYKIIEDFHIYRIDTRFYWPVAIYNKLTHRVIHRFGG